MVLINSAAISLSLSYFDIPDFKSEVGVSICFIENQGEILLLKNYNKSIQNNKWGAPGGKIQSNETPSQTAQREIFEETGIKLKAHKLQMAHTLYCRIPEIDSTLYIFKYQLKNIDKTKIVLDPNEHSEYTWVKIEDCYNWDLIQGEQQIIQLLYGVSLGRSDSGFRGR